MKILKIIVVFVFYLISNFFSCSSFIRKIHAINTPLGKNNIKFLEMEIFNRVNFIRMKYKRPKLIWSQTLWKIAKAYSEDMAERNFFSHIDPDTRMPPERLSALGVDFKYQGENLAIINADSYENINVNLLLKTWMNSIKHKENLLSSLFNKAGVGIFKYKHQFYVTMIFIS